MTTKRMAISRAFRADDVDDDERTIPFVLSTSGFKRDRINLRADGWELDSFQRNPVMLWAHDPRSMPIGRGENVRVEEGALRGLARFTTRDENPMGDMAFKLYRGGYLNAVSVGFELLDYEETSDGIDSSRHALSEFSGVPLPLDRDALVEGRANGIDTTPALEWAERLIETHRDDEELRQRVERIWSDLRTEKSYHRSPVGLNEVGIRITADTDEAEARLKRLNDLAERLRENTDAVRENAEAMRTVPEIFREELRFTEQEKQDERDDEEVVRIIFDEEEKGQ